MRHLREKTDIPVLWKRKPHDLGSGLWLAVSRKNLSTKPSGLSKWWLLVMLFSPIQIQLRELLPHDGQIPDLDAAQVHSDRQLPAIGAECEGKHSAG